jgi:GT2 family glycosyltransferase
MDVSILYVNTNDGKWILHSIERALQLYPDAEIVVADNCSTDGSTESIRERFPQVRIVSTGRNAGYTGGNNLAAKTASRSYLFVFNPDALLTPGALEPLLRRLQEPGVGAAGPKIRKGWIDGGTLLESAGGAMEFPLGEGPLHGYLQEDRAQFQARRDVAYLSGAAFMIRKDVFQAFGGFDERLWCYCEESDLFWRMRMRGLRCVYEPESLVYHKGSANFGEASPRKIYLQTRNRIIINLQNLAFFNALYFAFAEAVVGSLVQLGAWVRRPELGRAYTRAWRDALLMLPSILRTRAVRQRERTIADSAVLQLHERVGIFAALRRYVRFVLEGRRTMFGPM